MLVVSCKSPCSGRHYREVEVEEMSGQMGQTPRKNRGHMRAGNTRVNPGQGEEWGQSRGQRSSSDGRPAALSPKGFDPRNKKGHSFQTAGGNQKRLGRARFHMEKPL